MDKTRVEDSLIKMIQPKIHEIEEKFSQGKSLTQDDINTLLLKSQYNHINHLDLKLNEVTESVGNLEHHFEKLEQKVNSDLERLEQKVNSDLEKFEQRLESGFEAFEQKLTNLEQKIEINIQKALNRNMVTLIIVMGGFLTLFKIIDKF